MSSSRKKRVFATGSTAVGFLFAFPILLLSILALIDFAQVLATRSYAQWVASEILRSAQGSPELQTDLWQLAGIMNDEDCDKSYPLITEDHEKYCRFLRARSWIATQAAERLTSVYGRQVVMETFTFYDRIGGTVGSPEIKKHEGLGAAVLLPGASARYAGVNVNHTHLCAKKIVDPDIGCVNGPSGETCAWLFEDCSHPIDHSNPAHELNKLLALYPIELHMAS